MKIEGDARHHLVGYVPIVETFVGIVEKPAREDAPSNWTVVGRYILMPSVMDELTRSTKGAGGEIQLTDAISRSLVSTPSYGFAFHGQRFDCGNKKGFLAANNHFAHR